MVMVELLPKPSKSHGSNAMVQELKNKCTLFYTLPLNKLQTKYQALIQQFQFFALYIVQML